MKINISKRKEAEKTIYEFFNIIDQSGDNTKFYKDLISKMSEKEFISFFTELLSDPNMVLMLNMIDYEREIDINQVEKAAKFLGIPLEEEVVLPYINMNKEKPIVTRIKVIVGYIIVKRVQQMVLKKNSTSSDIADRSPTTGQVTGDDKNGRSSDQENIALVALGADSILEEFLGARSDGMLRKNQMYSDIAENGYCSLENLEADIRDRTALNTIEVFFLGMGIKTDLVSNDLLLPSTIDKM